MQDRTKRRFCSPSAAAGAEKEEEKETEDTATPAPSAAAAEVTRACWLLVELRLQAAMQPKMAQ
jgi:hypothetical protein